MRGATLIARMQATLLRDGNNCSSLRVGPMSSGAVVSREDRGMLFHQPDAHKSSVESESVSQQADVPPPQEASPTR
jgi:hypothetical protein